MPLTRRQFLKGSAIALAGATLTRSGIVANAAGLVGPRPKKVIILGAGMAGLVAAYELTQLGHDVTVLEARMRPGGRAFTIREPFSDGLYAEAGAARIPDNHDLTLKYVKLFDVPLEPMYPSRLNALRFDGGGGRREVPIAGFTEALGQNLGPDLGGNPTRWSKIKGGTDVLPRAMARRLADKIFYGSPVVRVEQTANNARVVFMHAGSPQTMSADRVLCTIPFSVLRSIELPSLSERKLDIIKHAEYAGVSRVYLQSKTRFWEEKGLNGFAFTNDAVEIWQPSWSQPGPRGLLMTYARPGEAERISGMKEGDRITSTLTQLDSFFPGLKEKFEGGASKCWVEDEWSRGAWSYVGAREFVNSGGADGTIHFAGEHLSNWSSWIQGALSSGLGAVKEINEAA